MLLKTCSPVRSAMQLPDPVAFRVGDISVYWFGVLFAIGVAAALAAIYLEAKRKKLAQDAWIDLCLVLIPCGVVGARLWYVLSHLSEYRQDFARVFQIWDGGLSIYGAVVFALLGLLAYALIKKESFLRLLDTLAPGVALAEAIAAWGNFFEQTGYGRLVENPALQWFPFAVLIERTHTIHYALFFYTFLVCLLVFCLLWFTLRKRAARDGVVTAWYLAIVFGAKFLLRLLAGEAPAFSGEQIACIALCLVGIVALLLCNKRPAATEPALPAEETAPDAAEPDAPTAETASVSIEEAVAMHDAEAQTDANAVPDPAQRDQ